MSKWPSAAFGSLYAIPSRNGLTRPSSVRGEGYRMAAMGEIFASDYVGDSDMDRVRLNERELGVMMLAEHDLLFARQSLVLSGAGKCSIVKGLSEPTTFESHLIRVRLASKKANPLFYMYYFHSPVSPMHSIVQQGVQAGIRASDLEALDVVVPPKEVQDRIADKLSLFDSAIDNARRQIALLEEAAMRLYHEWFVVNADPKWEKRRIVDVCVKIGAGGTPNRRQEKYWLNGTIAWIKTKELQDCWLFDSEEKITPAGLDGSSAKIYPENTVVMAIYASPTLGRLGIFDKPMCCNQAALCLVADESQVSWEWLYCQLFELRDEFNQIARGAGQQNLSGEVVKETVVRIPDAHAMSEFTNAVRPLFSQCRILGRQIGNLTEARDRLLPKLMSGEVSV